MIQIGVHDFIYPDLMQNGWIAELSTDEKYGIFSIGLNNSLIGHKGVLGSSTGWDLTFQRLLHNKNYYTIHIK